MASQMYSLILAHTCIWLGATVKRNEKKNTITRRKAECVFSCYRSSFLCCACVCMRTTSKIENACVCACESMRIHFKLALD